MSPLPTGNWLIESVIVNSETIVDDNEFVELHVREDELLIQPVGIRFLIAEENDEGLMLVSNGQMYRAQHHRDDRDFVITMKRPEISDTIKIHARIHDDSMTTVEREVVQV